MKHEVTVKCCPPSTECPRYAKWQETPRNTIKTSLRKEEMFHRHWNWGRRWDTCKERRIITDAHFLAFPCLKIKRKRKRRDGVLEGLIDACCLSPVIAKRLFALEPRLKKVLSGCYFSKNKWQRTNDLVHCSPMLKSWATVAFPTLLKMVKSCSMFSSLEINHTFMRKALSLLN